MKSSVMVELVDMVKEVVQGSMHIEVSLDPPFNEVVEGARNLRLRLMMDGEVMSASSVPLPFHLAQCDCKDASVNNSRKETPAKVPFLYKEMVDVAGALRREIDSANTHENVNYAIGYKTAMLAAWKLVNDALCKGGVK